VKEKRRMSDLNWKSFLLQKIELKLRNELVIAIVSRAKIGRVKANVFTLEITAITIAYRLIQTPRDDGSAFTIIRTLREDGIRSKNKDQIKNSK
jgi:hypothetical protein